MKATRRDLSFRSRPWPAGRGECLGLIQSNIRLRGANGVDYDDPLDVAAMFAANAAG